MATATDSRPTFIWDAPTLLLLLDHRSDDVARWAASHLVSLYPERLAEAMDALPRLRDDVAHSLLVVVPRVELPEGDMPGLQALLRQDRDPGLKARAAGLLLAHGESVGDDLLGQGPLDLTARGLVETDRGLAVLIQWYRAGTPSPDQLVDSFVTALGVEDLFAILEERSKNARHERLEELETQWGRRLPRVDRVKRWADARRLLEETVGALRAPAEIAQGRFPILAGEAQRMRDNLGALLASAEARIHRRQSPSQAEVHLLLAGVLGLCRDAASLQSLTAAGDHAPGWRAVVTRPWRATTPDPDLLALLRGHGPEETLDAVRAALDQEWSYLPYSLRMLSGLGTPGWRDVALEALRGDHGDALVDEAAEAERILLADHQEMAALVRDWRESPPEPMDLALVGDYPTPEVVELLLAHFERYATGPDFAEVTDTMREVGAKEFLEPLAREWRKGELGIASAVRFLAQLHGREHDARYRAAIEDAGESLTAVLGSPERISDHLEESLRRPSVSIPLRCTVCKRTYRYDVERIALGRTPGDFIIGQIIECKGCHSLESYEVTDETTGILAFEAVRLAAAARADKDFTKSVSSIFAGPVEYQAAGRSFRNPQEAYHFLEEEVRKDPDNPELRRRFGNTFRNGLRSDLALPHFQAAVRLNPRDLESLYLLAASLLENQRAREAAPHIERLLALCRDPETDEEAAQAIFPGLLEVVNGLEQETGRRIELFPLSSPGAGGVEPVELEVFEWDLSEPRGLERAWRFFRHGEAPKKPVGKVLALPPAWSQESPQPQEPVRVQKIGRNEPCPCGSGKKYKRCHGL